MPTHQPQHLAGAPRHLRPGRSPRGPVTAVAVGLLAVAFYLASQPAGQPWPSTPAQATPATNPPAQPTANPSSEPAAAEVAAAQQPAVTSRPAARTRRPQVLNVAAVTRQTAQEQGATPLVSSSTPERTAPPQQPEASKPTRSPDTTVPPPTPGPPADPPAQGDPGGPNGEPGPAHEPGCDPQPEQGQDGERGHRQCDD